jgi:surface antigen
MPIRRPGRLIAAIALAGAIYTSALAAPPDHAPAHGWRNKHDRPGHGHYVGYSGHRWDDDYGIESGRCNRDAVGAVLGGVVGGVVGSTIGKGDGRTVAIIAGTILGAVVGAEIGRDMDREDRACMGHALELARDGREVRWDQPRLGVTYLLTPTGAWRQRDQACRNFRIVELRGTKRRVATGHACRVSEGEWRLVR